MKNYGIPFSPPDITENEINAVVGVLKSGWVTSGPKVAQFEEDLSSYCGVNKVVAVSSATAALELVPKVLGFKPGDEVITTPYTYTATASSALHRNLKVKFVDVKENTFFMDEEKLADAITKDTKMITTVDLAGVPVDYDKFKAVLKSIGREDIVLMSDSSHSMGASYKGKKVGSQFDFHAFSFHAVKNLITAEGGAVMFNDNNFNGIEDLYKTFKLESLHGQSKDALSKMKAGAWKYDIVTDGYKCNMTDIHAAIGVEQLKRYEDMINKRKAIFELYNNELRDKEWAILPFIKDEIRETSYHVYPLRLRGFSEEQRNKVISLMGEMGIATNVHFTPLPMFTLYKKLGYKIEDYPNAYKMYANEISVPVYSILSLENAGIVVTELINCVNKVLG